MNSKTTNVNLKILILLTLQLFVINAFKIKAKDIVVKGYYVTLHNDTVQTQFMIPLINVTQVDTSGNGAKFDDIYTHNIRYKYPNLKRIQWELYYQEKSGQKVKLTPNNCRMFQFIFNAETFSYVSVPNNFLTTPAVFSFHSYDSLFIRLLIPGRLSLYQYYKNVGGIALIFQPGIIGLFYGYNPLSIHHRKLKYCLKKEGESEMHTYNSLLFRNNMIKYLSDSYITVFKLENMIYSEKDIVQIVKEYNSFKKLNP
jgi:hypothetical protein